ncbi:MAG: excinuclease ABC subunit UvrB [Alphaproteobacteria bacterium]|nr:excinuclease ABC subunit UvrB [Alphaproteobacteria bacterium]
MSQFKIQSTKTPSGSQPTAIKKLVQGIKTGHTYQTLLGVTGSGKTYTIAHVIEQIQKPTLILAHNKTLAAQLAQEYRELFPNNAVHYFVSYYDYYQPEAYVASSDTYIEKEAMINQEIERLRHATTQSLLSRKDVIVVASVSAIYGLGNPIEYAKGNISLKVGMKLQKEAVMRSLIGAFFERTNMDLLSGTFRVIGSYLEIMPTNEEMIYRLSFSGGILQQITQIHATTREIIKENLTSYLLFPAKHFVTSKEERERAVQDIKQELKERIKMLEAYGESKAIERERLKRRTKQDIALIQEIGYCNGIENYSRHFEHRKAGEPPHTLLSYFPKNKKGEPDFLTVIDESHITIPQLGGMYAGDRSRKETLVEYGFRLPSAIDNRPLTFDEFNARVGMLVYVSATPGTYELEKSGKNNIVEQIIRPTGLVDPVVDVYPVTADKTKKYEGQVKHFITEAKKEITKKGRVLVTTLTKKSAEDLSAYIKEAGLETTYLHSDIKTIERIEILTNFRRGTFDVLVGVNLLREGLDLPEVTLVAILDGDKEGFLRNERSLIQTIGRAARNVDGRVIIYADIETESLRKAIHETSRRRALQIEYNEKHNITPTTIIKNIEDITDQLQKKHTSTLHTLLKTDAERFAQDPKALLKEKREEMEEAVARMDFETAALIRDELYALEGTPKKKKMKKRFR